MRITGAQVFDLQEGFVQRDICFDGRLLSGSSADGKTSLRVARLPLT